MDNNCQPTAVARRHSYRCSPDGKSGPPYPGRGVLIPRGPSEMPQRPLRRKGAYQSRHLGPWRQPGRLHDPVMTFRAFLGFQGRHFLHGSKDDPDPSVGRPPMPVTISRNCASTSFCRAASCDFGPGAAGFFPTARRIHGSLLSTESDFLQPPHHPSKRRRRAFAARVAPSRVRNKTAEHRGTW